MMIASIAKQGLWASVDGKDSWTKLGTAAGSAKIGNRGTSIVYDPADPNTFWESGTYNGGGVYRTTNGGASFVQLGNAAHIDAVSVDFTDPNRQTLLVTVHESNHAFRSTDGGQTWFDLTSFLPSDIGRLSAPLVIDGHTFVLGTNSGKASAVLLSTDSGQTWTTAFDAGVIGQPFVASDGAIYWVLEQINGILMSQDHGATWDVVPPKTELLPNFGAMVELPDASLASISNDQLIVSTDHAQSWTAVGPAIPTTPSGLAYSPYRRAFYVWHFDCDFTTENPILADSIIRLDFDPLKA